MVSRWNVGKGAIGAGLGCAAAAGLACFGSLQAAGDGPPSPVLIPARYPQPAEPAPTASNEPAEVVVVMDDGSRYTGLLVEQTDDAVVLEVAGIEMRLRATDVARIDTLPPVVERYERLRASILDDDINGLLGLVSWLVSRHELDLAEKELLEVLRQEPRHPRALELQRLIEAERLLGTAVEGGENPADRDTGDPERRGKDEMPVLSEEEINLIRVYELDLRRAPRIMIRRETVERLLEEYRGDPLIPSTIEGREDLFRAARSDPVRVVEIIFRLKARHLYDQIQVLENPRSMQMFRERVHGTWLINSCAQCHNNRPEAPAGPQFITRRPNSDATVYSNFLILERYRLPDGTPLIRYDEPEKSPLLDMGLPRVIADLPHPDIAAARGWTPVLGSRNTSAYRNALAWIRSMYLPRPEYPIEYPPEAAEPSPVEPPIER